MRNLVKRLVCLISITIALAIFEINAQSYSGQASAGKLTVTAIGQPVVTLSVADTGELPPNGGSPSISSAGVNLPNSSPIVTLGNSTTSVQNLTSPIRTEAVGTVNSTNIGILGNTIAAGVITANATATCPGETLTGSSNITNLTINSAPIVVTGAPNQTITIFQGATPVGQLIINEQITNPRTITVNALHLTVTDPLTLTVTDVIIASARAGINCGVAPQFSIYSGRGTAVRTRQADVLTGDITTLIADTGPLPSAGSNTIQSTTAGAGIAGLLTTGTATSTTSAGPPAGTPNSSQSTSGVQNLGVTLINASTVSITATALDSNTQCSCSLATPSCTAGSNIAGLAVTVLGIPVNVNITGTANQVVPINVPLLGGITLTLNGRETFPGSITAYPLRIQTNLIGLVATDITVAESHSDITCGIGPSAGDGQIIGRVVDQSGRGIARARVTANNTLGVTYTATTNSFGYFTLRNLEVNEFYVINVSDGRNTFEPQTLLLFGSVSDVVFRALPAQNPPPSPTTTTQPGNQPVSQPPRPSFDNTGGSRFKRPV